MAEAESPASRSAELWKRLREGDLRRALEETVRQRREEEERGTGERVSCVTLPPVPTECIQSLKLPRDVPKTFLQRVLDAAEADDDAHGRSRVWHGVASRGDFTCQGAAVASVVSGSAAGAAGLRAGMELITVNGAAVAAEGDIAKMFAALDPAEQEDGRVPLVGDRVVFGLPATPLLHRCTDSRPDSADGWRLPIGMSAVVEAVRGDVFMLRGPEGRLSAELAIAAWRFADGTPCVPVAPGTLHVDAGPTDVCTGVYTLLTDRPRVWKQKAPSREGCFLVGGERGHWLVVDRAGFERQQRTGLPVRQGYLQSAPHHGLPPHRVSSWKRADTAAGKFIAAPGVVVTASPPLVPLTARSKRFGGSFHRFFLSRLSQEFLSVAFWYVLVLHFRSGFGDARPGVRVWSVPPSPLSPLCSSCGGALHRQSGPAPQGWKCDGVAGHRCRPDLGWYACARGGTACERLCERPGIKHSGVVREVSEHCIVVDYDGGGSVCSQNARSHGERRMGRDYWELEADPEFETVVRAEYKEALFDLMAAAFAMLCLSVPPLSKHVLLADYADCLAQALYCTFHASFPFDRPSFGETFQLSLQTNVWYWVTGLALTHPNVENWCVTRMHKQKLAQRAKRPRPAGRREILAERWDQFVAGHDRPSASDPKDRKDTKRRPPASTRITVADCDLYVEQSRTREDAKTTEQIRQDLFFIGGGGDTGHRVYFGERGRPGSSAVRVVQPQQQEQRPDASTSPSSDQPPTPTLVDGPAVAAAAAANAGCGWGCEGVVVHAEKAGGGDLETTLGIVLEGTAIRELEKGGVADLAGAKAGWTVREMGGETVGTGEAVAAAWERATSKLTIFITDERGYKLDEVGWYPWMGRRPLGMFSLDGSSPLIQHYLTHVTRANNELIADSQLDAPEQLQTARARANRITEEGGPASDDAEPQHGLIRRLRRQQLVGVPLAAGVPAEKADFGSVLHLLRKHKGQAGQVFSSSAAFVHPHASAGGHAFGKSLAVLAALTKKFGQSPGKRDLTGGQESPARLSPSPGVFSFSLGRVDMPATPLCPRQLSVPVTDYRTEDCTKRHSLVDDVMDAGHTDDDGRVWASFRTAVGSLSLGRPAADDDNASSCPSQARVRPATAPLVGRRGTALSNRPTTALAGGRDRLSRRSTMVAVNLSSPSFRSAATSKLPKQNLVSPSRETAFPRQASSRTPRDPSTMPRETSTFPRETSSLPREASMRAASTRNRAASAASLRSHLQRDADADLRARRRGKASAAHSVNLNPVGGALCDPQRCWTPISRQYQHMSIGSLVSTNAVIKNTDDEAVRRDRTLAAPLRPARQTTRSPSPGPSTDVGTPHVARWTRKHSQHLLNAAAHSNRVRGRQSAVTWETGRFDVNTRAYVKHATSAVSNAATLRAEAERKRREAQSAIRGQLREMQKAFILLLADHEREMQCLQSAKTQQHQQAMQVIFGAMDRARPAVTCRGGLEAVAAIRDAIVLVERHLAAVSAEARTALVEYAVRKGFELRWQIKQIRIHSRRNKATLELVDRLEREARMTDLDRETARRRAVSRQRRADMHDTFGSTALGASAAEQAILQQRQDKEKDAQMEGEGRRLSQQQPPPLTAAASAPAEPKSPRMEERAMGLSEAERAEARVLEAAGALPLRAADDTAVGSTPQQRRSVARWGLEEEAAPSRVREVINALLWLRAIAADSREDDLQEVLPDDETTQLIVGGTSLPFREDGGEVVAANAGEATDSDAAAPELEAVLSVVRDGAPLTRVNIRAAVAQGRQSAAAAEAAKRRQTEKREAEARALRRSLATSPRPSRPSVGASPRHSRLSVGVTPQICLLPPAAAKLPLSVPTPAALEPPVLSPGSAGSVSAAALRPPGSPQDDAEELSGAAVSLAAAVQPEEEEKEGADEPPFAADRTFTAASASTPAAADRRQHALSTEPKGRCRVAFAKQSTPGARPTPTQRVKRVHPRERPVPAAAPPVARVSLLAPTSSAPSPQSSPALRTMTDPTISPQLSPIQRVVSAIVDSERDGVSAQALLAALAPGPSADSTAPSSPKPSVAVPSAEERYNASRERVRAEMGSSSAMSERFLRSRILRHWRKRDASAADLEPPSHSPIGTWTYPAHQSLSGGLLGVAVQFGSWCAYQVVEEGGDLYFDQKLQSAGPDAAALRTRGRLRAVSKTEWEARFPSGTLRLIRGERQVAQGSMVTVFREPSQGRPVREVVATYADDARRAEMEQYDRRELFHRLSGTLDRKGGRSTKHARHLSFDGFAAIGSYVTWKDTAKPVGGSSVELLQRIAKSKKSRVEARREERAAAKQADARAAAETSR